LTEVAALRRRRELQRQHEDYRFLVLASVFANSQGGKKSGEPFTPADFYFYFPSLPQIAPQRPKQSLEEQDAVLEGLFRRMSRGNA
jgi:hypothetical protein